jgi:hypothetical protein
MGPFKPVPVLIGSFLLRGENPFYISIIFISSVPGFLNWVNKEC